MTVTYEVREHKGHGMSLDRPAIRDTIEFRVVAVDGSNERVVYSTPTWFISSVTPRQISGLRLQASKARKSYASYLERTGKRWEQEQDVIKGKDKFWKAVDTYTDYGARHVASLTLLCLRGVGLFPDEERRQVLAKGLEHARAAVAEKRKTAPSYFRMIDAYAESVGTTLDAEIEKRFSLKA